jgi:hypothetical protein
MRVFKQANVNLSLSHVEQSGDNRANGARLSDLIAKEQPTRYRKCRLNCLERLKTDQAPASLAAP